MTVAQDVHATLESRRPAALDRLVEWLRMPSIGTDPVYRDDTRRAAKWCADQLAGAGFEAELRETGTPDRPGNPIVWATCPGAPSYQGPHVLFYGHYDVQPPDPLDLWNSPPFEPVILDGASGPPRIVARGACDDKGQVSTFIEALRAWKDKAGEIPVKFTVLIEGEEESGSVNLEHFVRAHKDELSQPDICLISDTGMLERGTPAITCGVRGLCYTQIRLHGPDQDLHSGLWGGRVLNPNTQLAMILSQLWDEERRITLPGFYDKVKEVPADLRKAWTALAPTAGESLAKIGLGAEADLGEEGFNHVEREWARPACDINGIYGGYIGAGAKTVIPAYSTAKVSFRLVADQNPIEVRDSFFAWLEARTPAGFRWEFEDLGLGFPGNVDVDSPYLQAAVRALRAASGKEPHLIKSGGSIPVVGLLRAELGLDTLLVGFGLEDDRVHSPNEKFEISSFALGVASHVHLLEEFQKLS